MGSAGCLVTAICSGLTNYAIDRAETDGDITPGELCDRIISKNGFTASGDLLLDSIRAIFPQVHLLERQWTTNYPGGEVSKMNIDTALVRIRRLLSLGQPVMLHVDAVGNDKRPDHFVVAYDSTSFWVIDPWDGKRLRFSERYGDPSKGIFGYVAYVGPAIAYDIDGDNRAGTALWKLLEYRADPKKYPHYLNEAIQHLI